MSDELSAGGRVEDQTAIREIDTRGIFLFWKMSFLIKKRRDYRGFFLLFSKKVSELQSFCKGQPVMMSS